MQSNLPPPEKAIAPSKSQEPAPAPKPIKAKGMLEKLFPVKKQDLPAPDEKAKKTGMVLAKAEGKKVSAYLNSVSIALDEYDDIFSDFDPSPYSVRALSDDFLKELTKRYGENGGGSLRIVFSLPKAQRSKNSEVIIRERLKKYFENKLVDVDNEVKEETRTGISYIGVGAMLLTGCVLITTYLSDQLVFKIASELLLVPGWFGEFMGFEKIVESRAKASKTRKFFEKFRDAAWVFASNEDLVEKMVAATAETKSPEKPADPKPPAP